MTTITITLASGDSRSLQVRKTPKHWKSVLLRQLPYGTDVQGATYSVSDQLDTYVIPSMRSEEYGAALHAEAAAEGHQAGMWHDTSACGFRH